MALAQSSAWSFMLAAAALGSGVIALAALHGGGESVAGAEARDAASAVVDAAGDAEPLVVVVELETPASTVEVALLRVGLNPGSLAAAGVSSTAFGTLLQLVDDWFGSNPTALADADAAYGDARKTRDTLQRIVSSGLATSEQVSELAAAKSSFESAESSRMAVLDSLFAAATAELSAPQIASLAQVRANDRWKFPVQFLVEAREQATWVQLRDALANERIAPQFGDEPDAGCQSLLSELEGRQAVVQASANLGTYLSSIEASWEASLH